MRWFGVKSDDIHKWQSVAEPFIRRALEHSNGDCSVSDIFRECRQAKLQLWLVYDERSDNRPMAAVVTTISQAPRQKRCVIVYLAGEGIMDWLHFLEQLEAWAKSNGCSKVTIQGRPGWERMLSGYAKTAVVLEKQL